MDQKNIDDEDIDDESEEEITMSNFVPDEEDIFIIVDDECERQIFGHPIQFTEEEMEKVKEFKEYLNENKLEVPEEYDFRELFRFYQSCKFDLQSTYEAILEHQEFVKQNIPVNIDGINDYLQNGVMYFLKRDRHFRPIFIINLRKVIDAQLDDDKLVRVILSLITYTLDHCMKPGFVENWFVIIDCKDVGATEVPVNQIRLLATILQKNFKGRLFRLYGLNVPFLLRAIWMIAKSLGDKFTQAKMIMYGSGYSNLNIYSNFLLNTFILKNYIMFS